MKSAILFSLVLMNVARAATPTMTIACTGHLNFDIDIYTSGHPMGGATRYSGLTSFDGENTSFLRTSLWKEGIVLSGEGTGLERSSYKLTFHGNPYLQPQDDLQTELEITKRNPMSGDTVKSYPLECHRTL